MRSADVGITECRDHSPGPTGRPFGRRGLRRVALPALLLLSVAAGCYPPAQARRELVPSWQPRVAQSHATATGARLRFGTYLLDDFQGSQAMRRWPLLDSRTVSRRYEYRVHESGAAILDAACRVGRVMGDAVRDRSDLACALVPRRDTTASWHLNLNGEGPVAGTLRGPARAFEIAPRAEGGERGKRAAGYAVLFGSEPVATLSLRGRSQLWISPLLAEEERMAITATIFALLLEREMRTR
jgi:hypothetical protein